MINRYQHIIDVKNQFILSGRSCVLTYMCCRLHSALHYCSSPAGRRSGCMSFAEARHGCLR